VLWNLRRLSAARDTGSCNWLDLGAEGSAAGSVSPEPARCKGGGMGNRRFTMGLSGSTIGLSMKVLDDRYQPDPNAEIGFQHQPVTTGSWPPVCSCRKRLTVKSFPSGRLMMARSGTEGSWILHFTSWMQYKVRKPGYLLEKPASSLSR